MEGVVNYSKVGNNVVYTDEIRKGLWFNVNGVMYIGTGE